MRKRIIWKFILIVFYSKARGVILINLSREVCMKADWNTKAYLNYIHSFRTSQRTPSFCIMKTDWLLLRK